MASVEEDAAVANAADAPAAGVWEQRVGGGAREEGEGEVSSAGDCTGYGRGGVRRERGVEAVPVHEADEGGRVFLTEAAEEGIAGGDLAEGDAGGGGVDEVGWGG